MGDIGATPHLDGTDLHIAIVVARFNEDVTKRLLRGAQEVLQSHGVEDPDVYWVPGAFELPVTALALAEKGEHDAIICLGCVVRGETTHCDANEIASVHLDKGIFTIKRTDAKEGWFSSKGVFKFNYGNLANAQLFAFVLERLVGAVRSASSSPLPAFSYASRQRSSLPERKPVSTMTPRATRSPSAARKHASVWVARCAPVETSRS